MSADIAAVLRLEHTHAYLQTHTQLQCIVKSHLWQNMRNPFQSVTATFRSEIIIQCNWYTLWNVLVFDLGPLKVSYSDSLVTNMPEIWHSILILIFLFQKSLFQKDALVM